MLYDYQEQMLERIASEFAKTRFGLARFGQGMMRHWGRAVMVQMPTGTGKTYLMAAVVEREIGIGELKELEPSAQEVKDNSFVDTDGTKLLSRITNCLSPIGPTTVGSNTHKLRIANPQGLKKDNGIVGSRHVCSEIWIVAHRRELVEQTGRTLEKFGLGYTDGMGRTDGNVRIRVMSIQWLSRNFGRMTEKPGLIIIDEAHHALADTYQELWTRFPEARKLGLTATPCRMQKKGFTELFDVLLMSWSIKEFIRKGRLALYDYVVINKFSEDQRAVDSLEKRGTDGDYSIAEMGRKLNRTATIERLYDSIEKYAKGKKGIVYAIDICHAKAIADHYSAKGMKAAAIDSKTPAGERTALVNDFKEGRLDCIVNVNLFDEGFDCPDVEFIQMARPTLSLAKYMQMIGRGLRVHPDKKMCVMIDNVGLYRMFGLPDANRDWLGMFEGETAGKGRVIKQSGTANRIDNGMEVVANHSRLMNIDDQEKYLENVEPFEKDGRWGLRVGTDIVLRPVYRYISPFIGKYCTFELIPGLWGVLRRNGRRCIPPEFRKIELQPDGYAVLERNEISRRRVNIATTFTNRKDLDEWWGEAWK